MMIKLQLHHSGNFVHIQSRLIESVTRHRDGEGTVVALASDEEDCGYHVKEAANEIRLMIDYEEGRAREELANDFAEAWNRIVHGNR